MSDAPADEHDDAWATALRDDLVESNFDALVTAYREALQAGVADPVAFLVDCEDPIGNEIARAWEGDEPVREAIAEARAARDDDEAAAEATTILIRAFSFADCREEVPAVFPYLARSFAQPPAAGQMLLVAIAAEGAATFTSAAP